MAIFLFLGLFGIGYYFYSVKLKNQTSPSNLSTNRILQSMSGSYKEADSFYTQRQYDKAIEKYNAALNDTDSLKQEVLVRTKLAMATNNAGDSLGAVEIFKDIVDNPKYAIDDEEIKRAKSHAVSAMIGLFYQMNDRAVANKIFSGKPYEDFIKKEDAGDLDIAFRRLAEYASSLSSTPDLMVEARIIKWYAIKVYDLKTETGISEEEKKFIPEYEAIVKSKLAYIDKNYGDDQNYYVNSKRMVLPVLLRLKGIAVGSLTAAGDTSLGNPETVFQEALALPQPPWVSNVTKYVYAVYLAADFGEQRKNDIANLLSFFYEPPRGTEPNLQTLLLNELNGQANPTHTPKSLRLLASVDPKFKELLVGLGWQI